MSERKIVHNRTKIDIVALTLLLTAEICFYRVDTINIYFLLSGFGIISGLVIAFTRYMKRIINMKRFPVWLICFWIIYMVNGLFRLQRGTFPWDTTVYRFAEILAMYFLFRDIVSEDKSKIVYPFVFAGIFSLGYLLYTEGNFVELGIIRIGNRMSGNVNTVGYNFGIVSLFIMWWYCTEKRWYKFLLYLVFAAFMLLTGSKKVLILILVAFLVLFAYERGHASRWLKFALGLFALLYIIFNIPIFYEMIGVRIETMISTLLYGSSSPLYSYSTDVRDNMIHEGFRIFLSKPIFGGGYNYFYANTSFGYDYSHNNYIELLCTFGIVGTLLYYNKHIGNLVFLIKRGIDTKFKENQYIFPIALLVAIIMMDWAAVSFSAICVWYVPIIVSSVLVEEMKYGAQQGDTR